MIHNMTGGGGAGLNLKVAGGTTQPTSPAENTIWVNTDTEINGYAFSATEPENPTEGMVWFETSKNAIDSPSVSAPINVSPKNNVMVYPVACKQYINGTWVSKTAKTYQGGVWLDWLTYLFKDGNFCEGITGGWVNRGKLINDSFYVGVDFVANTDNLTLSSTKNGASGSASTVNKVPINNKSKLCADIVLTGHTPNEALLCLTSATSYIYSNAAAAAAYGFKQVPFTGVIEVDISNVSGEYYVVIGAHANNSTNNGPGVTLKVNRIWIE